MSISTYTLFSDAAVETALDAVGGEMMGTQDTELLKQIFVAAGNGGGGGGVISNPGVAYVRTDGNNSTAEIGNPAKPYLTATAAWLALKAFNNSASIQNSIDLGVGDFTLTLTSAEVAAGYQFFLSGDGGSVDATGQGGSTLTISSTTAAGQSMNVSLIIRSDLSVKVIANLVAGGGGNGDLTGSVSVWATNIDLTSSSAGGTGSNSLTANGNFSVLAGSAAYGSVTGCYVDGTFTYV